MTKIFISYRRADSKYITARIRDWLIHRYGRDEIFRDVDAIPAGVDFRQFIKQSISGCQVVLAIIGTEWLDIRQEDGEARRLDDPKDLVRLELEMALEDGRPIIPVLVSGASMPDREELPRSLATLAGVNAAQVLDDPHFESTFDQLVAEIERQAQLASEPKRVQPEEHQAYLVDGVAYWPREVWTHGPYAEFCFAESDGDAGTAENSTASDATHKPPRHIAVHRLRPEGAKQEHVRQWFARRFEISCLIEHERFLRPHRDSKPNADHRSPYLVTEYLPNCRPLATALQSSGGKASDDNIRRILFFAAKICEEAHGRADDRFLLLSLPPENFVVAEDHRLYLTSLDVAVRIDDAIWSGRESLSAHFDVCCPNWSSVLAPEIVRHDPRPSPTADVFALGVLLARLLALPIHEQETLEPKHWHDPWHCFAYHCLATNPAVRFQNMKQFQLFLKLLKNWTGRGGVVTPQTVEIPGGAIQFGDNGRTLRADVDGFRIGLFPVTNREYVQYCQSENVELPMHLRGIDPLCGDAARLSGPWCPVTYVSHTDATNYCEWLSRKANQVWRLPTEAEWIRAARLDASHAFPWPHPADDMAADGRANYDRRYRGPTVVGAFEDGRSVGGCYDLAGNVWEWCADFVDGGDPLRVIKGGAYDYGVEAMRVSHQQGHVVLHRSPHVGFRIVCENS